VEACAAFADLLDERLRALDGDRPTAAEAARERATRPSPPHPLLFAPPYAFAGRNRYVVGERETSSEPKPRRFCVAREADDPRRPRTLSAGQSMALARLNALGASLPPDFTDRELRSAFRRLARRFHPDRHPGDRPSQARLAQIFRECVEHYRRLRHVTRLPGPETTD
jgi:hypothetical protein